MSGEVPSNNPLVNLSGAQLGDVKLGDMAGRDLYRLDFSANSGTIVVNLGDAANPRAIAAGASPAGTALEPATLPQLVRLPARKTPPATSAGFRDRTRLLAELAAIGAGEARWLRGPAGCGISALLRQGARAVALPADGIVLLDATAEATESRADDLLQAVFERFYRSSAYKPSPAEMPNHLGALEALVLLDHLPPLNADELGRIHDALAGSMVLVAGQGDAPDTFAALRLDPLPMPDAMAMLAPAAPEPANQTYLERVCTALAASPLALDLARRLLAMGRYGAHSLAVALGQAAAEPLARAAECALVTLSKDERTTLAALMHGCGPYQRAEELVAATALPLTAVEKLLETLGDLGLVSGSGAYHVRTRSLRRALAALLPAREERRAAAAAFATAAFAHHGDLAWLEQHRAHAMDAITRLLELGEPQRAGALARELAPALVGSGRWDAWGALLGHAFAAADAGGDAALRAWALHERGTRLGLSGRPDLGAGDLTQAERLREAMGDHRGAAVSRRNRELLRPALAPDAVRRRNRRGEAGGGGIPGYLWPILLLAAVLGAGAGLVAVWPLLRPSTPLSTQTDEDTQVSVSLDGGGPFRLEGGSSAQGGALAIQGSTLVYTPPADFNGADEAVVLAGPRAERRVVTITVAPVPDPPLAGDDTQVGREDEALELAAATLLANDSDRDGDTLVIVRVEATSSQGGQVALDGATVRYTPPANQSGDDSFGYVVSDGRLEAGARVTIQLAATSDPPRPGALTLEAREDEPLMIARVTLLGAISDADSAQGALRLLPPPASSARGGTLALVGDGDVLYTPAPNFSGSDSYVGGVEDESGGRAELTVTIVVAEVNDPPAVSDLTAGTPEDQALTITRADLLRGASDVEDQAAGRPLELALPTNTSERGGALSLDPSGNIVYMPPPNYYGPDSVGFLVRDSGGAGTGAGVALVVEPVNDPPQAVDDTLSIKASVPNTFALTLPGAATRPTPVSAPHQAGGKVLAQRATTADGSATADLAWRQGGPSLALSGADLLANDRDIDGDVLQLTRVSDVGSAGGKIVWNRATNMISYFAAARARQESFAYTVCDPGGLCDEGQVVITIVDATGPRVSASAGIPECDPLLAQFRAQATDGSGVRRVTLRYRLLIRGRSGNWVEQAMTLANGVYTTEVKLPRGADIEYEIEAQDTLGNISTRSFGQVTETIIC